MGQFTDLEIYSLPKDYALLDDFLSSALDITEHRMNSDVVSFSTDLALQQIDLIKINQRMIAQRKQDPAEWLKGYGEHFSEIEKMLNTALQKKFSLQTVICYALNLNIETTEMTKEAALIYGFILLTSIFAAVISKSSLQAFFSTAICLGCLEQAGLYVLKHVAVPVSEQEIADLKRYTALKHAQIVLAQFKKVWKKEVAGKQVRYVKKEDAGNLNVSGTQSKETK